ncbi:hypothetical protein PM8797T_05875 [Gimesia maris DSM 8797]|nr:hypothetical protein PM8797T_05875 [Gimesia maris DSM 8797]
MPQLLKIGIDSKQRSDDDSAACGSSKLHLQIWT